MNDKEKNKYKKFQETMWRHFNKTNNICPICQNKIEFNESDIVCVNSKIFNHYKFYHKKCIKAGDK